MRDNNAVQGLIGRTEAVLWDVDRPRPALLTPGMWVRFRAVDLP